MMSTGLIIAIIVAVLIILAILFFVLPRARRQAQVKARERELGQRRERVATEHRDTATEREREAEAAEQRARMAQAEAERERADAQLHQERAQMHERGLADHELVEDHEREQFSPAMNSDADVRSEPREGGTAHEPMNEYDRGRLDEREADEGGGRFDRGSGTTPTEGEQGGARRI
jgi:FtsZ-interacting cell division protein ZipA